MMGLGSPPLSVNERVLWHRADPSKGHALKRNRRSVVAPYELERATDGLAANSEPLKSRLCVGVVHLQRLC